MMPIGPTLDRRSDRRQSAFSVDTLFTAHGDTKRDMDALQATLQVSQAGLVRHLITMCSPGVTSQKVREFYLTKWKTADKQNAEIVRVRFRNTKTGDKALGRISIKIVGEENKSLALRTMVAYFAFEYGVRKR